MARAGADDVTAVGPANLVLPAVEVFASRQVEEHCLYSTGKRQSQKFSPGMVTCPLARLQGTPWLERRWGGVWQGKGDGDRSSQLLI